RGRILNEYIKTKTVVVNGAGAAAVATTKLLSEYGFNDIIICDSKGIISKTRTDLNPYKTELFKFTNLKNYDGDLNTAVKGADIFIGLSVAGALTKDMVRTMSANPIIFAMANPDPEIIPADAKEAG